MKKVRFIALMILLPLAILLVSAVTFVRLTSDNLSKDQIISLVQTNEASLRDMGEQVRAYKITGAKAVTALGIRGIQNISLENGCVDFYCGGSGIGSSTSYYGFYYAWGDWFSVILGRYEGIRQQGNTWQWEEPGGDDRFIAQDILPNFYYYEEHY